MRIASLLPSATEIVCALGLGEDLVAVTHECDYPPGVERRTHVTRSLLAEGLSSAAIDRAVLESAHAAHSIYELDVATLAGLRPDLILTQDLCEVCAVPRSAVDAAAALIEPAPRVLSLDPSSLDDVLADMLEVGRATGREEASQAAVAELRERIDAVRAAVGEPPPKADPLPAEAHRPRVLCCEWLDPIYCAGHWVPEQVQLAGGEDGLGRPGRPSITVEWEAVRAYQPEVVVLMPCGFNAAQSAARLEDLSRRPGWAELPAVVTGQVFAVDASSYFSRPGPRLVDGLELLARILSPRAYGGPAPDGAARRLNAATGEFEPYR